MEFIEVYNVVLTVLIVGYIKASLIINLLALPFLLKRLTNWVTAFYKL